MGKKDKGGEWVVKKYIDAETVKTGLIQMLGNLFLRGEDGDPKIITDSQRKTLAEGFIEKAPAANVRENRQGKWTQVDDNKCRCSECDTIVMIAVYPHWEKNFCPCCGANMSEHNNGDTD